MLHENMRSGSLMLCASHAERQAQCVLHEAWHQVACLQLDRGESLHLSAN